MRFATCAALATALIGSLGCNMHRRPDPEQIRKFVGYYVNDTLDEIGASDSQRQVVNAAKDQLLARLSGRAEQHKKLADALLSEWEKDRPDAARVQGLLDAELESRRAMMRESLDEVIRVHDVLTPEQRAEIARRVRERLAD